jgi:hypothetical protein
MLPYSDKNTLISAILFYESTLKSLRIWRFVGSRSKVSIQ